MANTLPDITLVSGVFLNINALSGIAVGKPMIINNKSSGTCLLQIKPTAPLNTNNDGVQIVTTGFYFIGEGEDTVWIKGQNGRLSVMEG